jgi:type II secretory ATPase GspE/PulE/Tfp pilus assembly ATPase PilB-like protein
MVSRNRGTENSDEVTVVKLLDRILERAVTLRASDIHIEPKDDQLDVRFRVDGVLVPQKPLPKAMSAPLTSRVKILAQMDISEKRVPQDGTFALDVADQKVNIRCSSLPTYCGEKVVLRLLADSLILTNLATLGVKRDQLGTLMKGARASSGLILVSGPTGSGKTSTLHSILKQLEGSNLNITTLEDPIEIRSAALNQAQVNNRAGFTFAGGLRAILRQDPDVILVGEMRDLETAQIAFRASLTGHLVLSTVHTSTTVETITRLLDIGLEPYLVASSLSLVVAQRLVRVLCPRCREAYEPDGDERDVLGFALPPLDRHIYRARGCSDCAQTGYKGRTGLFEVLEVNDELRALIKAKRASDAYKKVLAHIGLPTLRRDGIRKVVAGITTIDEVMRVT